MKIIKRNGAEEVFDVTKIVVALQKANTAVEEQYRMTPLQIKRITEHVLIACEEMGRSPSVEEIQDLVEKAIDPLETVKDSSAYTFRVGLNSALDTYYNGAVSNVAEQKRFDKQTAKYEAAVARGKTPNGKVAPLALVDLEVAQASVMHILTGMREQFVARAAIVDGYDYQKRGVRYIEWLRETALGEIHKITRSMAKDTAIRIMEQVGITEARKRFRQYPFEFSGGMRQRIVIAIALSADPEILICDEPTTALDVTIQAQILELINKLKRERNLSVIFITHDLGVVANVADRVAVMYAGQIVEAGTVREVYLNPRHPYTRGLFDSIPKLDDDSTELIPIEGAISNAADLPTGCYFHPRCRYCQDICKTQQPTVKGDDHKFMCHFDLFSKEEEK